MSKGLCEMFASDALKTQKNVKVCREIASKLWDISEIIKENGLNNLTISIESDTISFNNSDWYRRCEIDNEKGIAMDTDTGESVNPVQYRQYVSDLYHDVIKIVD